ncbi:unnamed protein product, partial [Ixodes hexagonus]
TDSGLVAGTRITVGEKPVDAYLGVPYAEPPVGDLRFKRPVPISPWNGTYNATSKPKPCWQLDLRFVANATMSYSNASEDCLYVNVWKPADSCSLGSSCAKKYPVVIFIHGGAFQWGDSSLFLYDPANFVALSDVVFVTFNYRLSILGFLSLETAELPGNMGLWDQNLVLKWVRKNIASFGGDPNEVTLSGQSAGGVSAGLHAISPHSQGLFKRVVMESGTPFSMILAMSHKGTGKFVSIAGALGCYDANRTLTDQLSDIMVCLREIDPRSIFKILKSADAVQQFFAPVHGDDFFPLNPFSKESWNMLHFKEIILGTTRNEGTLFVENLRERFPGLGVLLATDYRLAITIVLAPMLDIPISQSRRIVKAYFGGYDLHHDSETVERIFSRIFGDGVFNCPTKLFADITANQGINTYRFLFSHRPSFTLWPKWMGVVHTDELPFTLGSLAFLNDEGRSTPEEAIFMKQIVSAWTSFIYEGEEGQNFNDEYLKARCFSGNCKYPLPPSSPLSSGYVVGEVFRKIVLSNTACIFIVTGLISAEGDVPIVRTDTGLVAGERITVGDRLVDAFMGIPYAEPPVGDLRFRKPRPIAPWNGTYSAKTKPTPCWQQNLRFLGREEVDFSGASEDCLYLNIWRQFSNCTESDSCGEKRPVVVFIQGGAFQWGDSSFFVYDAANFVTLADVVYVTFNHRLGFFGFLSLETPELPGNMGLWDQNLVFKWVRRNIEHFGGDPDDVTIVGQSAGGISAGMHAVSPQSQGLFKRIVMQSGTPLSMILGISYKGTGKFSAVSGALGCYDLKRTLEEQTGDVIACLKKLDAAFVYETLKSLNLIQQMFGPVHGDEFLPHHPLVEETYRNLKSKELLLGTTLNEGTLFYDNLEYTFPGLKPVLSDDYRLAVTVALGPAFEIPVSQARRIVRAYFGDYNVEHDSRSVADIFSRIFGDAVFHCPTQLFADVAAEQGISTYRYMFEHRPTYTLWPEWMGVVHADELLFTIGSQLLMNVTYTPEEETFMKRLVSTWNSFIRNG